MKSRWAKPPKCLVIDGVSRTYAEWAALSGTPVQTIRNRKENRWPSKLAVYARPAPGYLRAQLVPRVYSRKAWTGLQRWKKKRTAYSPLAVAVLVHLVQAADWRSTPAVILAVAPPDHYRCYVGQVRHVLNRWCKTGLIRRLRSGYVIQWCAVLDPDQRTCRMTLDDAKDMVVKGVEFGTVYEFLAEQDKLLFKEWFVRQPGVPNLGARAGTGPVGTGEACKRCGGMFVRTGTCLTCQGCGDSSGGCG